MPPTEPHEWQFEPRFRKHGFGWRSKPAVQRIREAVREIRNAARVDPVLGAEGGVTLLERLSPALEHVDSSSAAIVVAARNAMRELGL
jgi:broad specificity phosphatase PhoE